MIFKDKNRSITKELILKFLFITIMINLSMNYTLNGKFTD